MLRQFFPVNLSWSLFPMQAAYLNLSDSEQSVYDEFEISIFLFDDFRSWSSSVKKKVMVFFSIWEYGMQYLGMVVALNFTIKLISLYLSDTMMEQGSPSGQSLICEFACALLDSYQEQGRCHSR